MYPILFRLPEWFPLLGGEPITSFGAMMFLSFMTAGLIFKHQLDKDGLDGSKAWDILFWAVIGGIGGARLYYLLMHLPQVLEDPSMLLARGGLTWYGGLILATLLTGLKIRSLGLPLGRTFDAMAPAMPIAYAVGRVGCFLVGDDYGRPTGSWVGMAFPEGSPPTRVDVLERQFGITVDPELVERFGQVIPVHPTQLYEIALSLLIFLAVMQLGNLRRAGGWLFLAWLALYGVERFIVEFVRAKDDRILFDLLTSAQLLSILIVAGALLAMNRLSRNVAGQGGSAGG